MNTLMKWGLAIATAFTLLIPASALATPTSVDRVTDHIQPLIQTDYIQGDHFNATSTIASSTFKDTETTRLKVGSLSGFLKAVAGYVTTALVNLTSDVTGILPVANGGSGAATFSAGLLGGNGTNPFFSSATTTASCSGSTSCSPFTVIGSSPITISSTGGGGGSGLSTTTPWTPGQVAAVSSNSAVYGVSTTSFTPSAEFSVGGTIGALVGGANSTLALATNGVALTKIAQVAANTVLGNNTGALGNVVAFATSTLGIALSDTTGILAANRGGAGTVSGILKANGSGTVSAAAAGTDYAPATSGSSILSGNGSGGFSNVTVGNGISFAGGTLSSYWSLLGNALNNNTGQAVGVNVTNPTAALEVAATTTGSTIFQLWDTTKTINRFNVQESGNVGISSSTPWADFSVNGVPNGTDNLVAIASSTGASTSTVFRVDSNGKVAIGADNTTTGGQLNVQAAALGRGVFVTTTGTFGDTSNQAFYAQNNNNSTNVFFSPRASDVAFGTTAAVPFFINQNQAIRAIIDNNGNFGAGYPGSNTLDAQFSVSRPTGGNAGTVTVVGTSPTVTGSGTMFINTFRPGDTITANSETHTITSVNSNTSLTTDVWTGSASAQTYTTTNLKSKGLLAFANGNVSIASTTPWAFFAINPDALGKAPVGTAALNEFVIGSSTATHLVVNAAGFVGLGTTTPYAKLSVDAPADVASYFAIGSSTSPIMSVSPSATLQYGVGTSSPWRNIGFAGTGAWSGLSAATSGNVTLCINATTKEIFEGSTGTTCTPSSEVYKTNIATSTVGIEELMALRPVTFAFKAGDKSSNLGFIAQEVRIVDPRLVEIAQDGTVKGLRLDNFMGLVVKSVQDLATHQDNQDKEIAELKAQVKALQSGKIDNMCRL